MHFYAGGWFWGMHFIWWMFWLLFITLFFGMMTPVPRHKVRETPLQILRRRYAVGEITGAEYDERKTKLEQDRDTNQK